MNETIRKETLCLLYTLTPKNYLNIVRFGVYI